MFVVTVMECLEGNILTDIISWTALLTWNSLIWPDAFIWPMFIFGGAIYSVFVQRVAAALTGVVGCSPFLLMQISFICCIGGFYITLSRFCKFSVLMIRMW